MLFKLPIELRLIVYKHYFGSLQPLNYTTSPLLVAFGARLYPKNDRNKEVWEVYEGLNFNVTSESLRKFKVMPWRKLKEIAHLKVTWEGPTYVLVYYIWYENILSDLHLALILRGS